MASSSSSSSSSSSAATVFNNSSSSPCAACKSLRRKCQPECVFAPYFPPEQPQKFTNVHKVFGASNVTKLLNELHPHQREDAVNSLAYEADMRLRDPVYGCVGVISLLQHQLRQLQLDLTCAKSELSKYHTQISSLTTTAQQMNLGGGGYYHHHHQLFPISNLQQQMMMMRSFDTGNNYVSTAIGSVQLMNNQLQQTNIAAGATARVRVNAAAAAAAGGGDVRRTPINPS